MIHPSTLVPQIDIKVAEVGRRRGVLAIWVRTSQIAASWLSTPHREPGVTGIDGGKDTKKWEVSLRLDLFLSLEKKKTEEIQVCSPCLPVLKMLSDTSMVVALSAPQKREKSCIFF